MPSPRLLSPGAQEGGEWCEVLTAAPVGSARCGLEADEMLELNGGRLGTWSRGLFGNALQEGAL